MSQSPKHSRTLNPLPTSTGGDGGQKVARRAPLGGTRLSRYWLFCVTGLLLATGAIHIASSRTIVGVALPPWRSSLVLMWSCGGGTILLSVDFGDGIEDLPRGLSTKLLSEFRSSFWILTEAGVDVDPYNRGFSARTGCYTLPDGSSVKSASASFPCWSAELVLLPYVLFLAWGEFVRPMMRARTGRCVRCGYVLHGLPDPRCPECGAPFRRTPEEQDQMRMEGMRR